MQYLKRVLVEVLFAVMPLSLVITVLQFTLIKLPFETYFRFLTGAFMVSSGLMLFLLGAHWGLLPIGELIGAALPRTGKIWMTALFGFLLGLFATLAEPDVRVLATHVDIISEGAIPKGLLIASVALGVAFFVVLGLLRTVKGWPLLYLLLAGYGLVLVMAMVTPHKYLPISLDAGGVTTGPMTVPFILSLGMGISSVLRGRSASGEGFGLVDLASIGPILGVMLLGVVYG